MNRYNAATGRYIHMPEPEESRNGILLDLSDFF